MSRALFTGLVLCAAALTGCVSSGVDVRPEQTASFRPGITTQADVTTRLGTPTTRATLPDGSTMLLYSFAAAKARPETFIPIIGAFIGGADVHSSMVSFQFGPDGTLTKTSSTATQTGSRLGTTTTDAPMRTDTPRQVQ